MRKIKSGLKFCINCLEEHEVDFVKADERVTFKDEEVDFTAYYEYCPNENVTIETEQLIKTNDLAMKDAYRKKMNLLTSQEIIEIREKYKISQKDFSEVLNWGRATITRYENHQVQDRGNDNVLRKIKDDPKWFLEMLSEAKDRLSVKAYNKYHEQASKLYKERQNQYLMESILSHYAGFVDETATGGVSLNLLKVVDMINYFASKVNNLHKVKLAKMLWFSDYLHYKRHKIAISGLVYSALPMGAVPEGYDKIILLEGISFEKLVYENRGAFKFKATPGFKLRNLSELELETINDIISNYGRLKTKEIVDKMHEEEAYKCTDKRCVIPFSFAEKLIID